MNTTLNKIKKHEPCQSGWNNLLKGLNKTKADDEPLELLKILEINGIKDAVWALRCFEYKEYGLFLADIAESVLPIYAAKYNDDVRPKNAIKAIKDYCSDKIDKETLLKFADAAYAAYVEAYTYATTDAEAAYAAAETIYSATVAYAYATADAADAATRVNKWAEIEELLIKHIKSTR